MFFLLQRAFRAMLKYKILQRYLLKIAPKNNLASIKYAIDGNTWEGNRIHGNTVYLHT
jgi:hypothetical protein